MADSQNRKATVPCILSESLKRVKVITMAMANMTNMNHNLMVIGVLQIHIMRDFNFLWILPSSQILFYLVFF